MTRRTLIPTPIHHSRCAGPRRGGVGGGAVGGSGCMRGQQKHRHAEGDREGAQKTHAVHENTTCGAFELNGLLTSSMGCLRAEGHVDSNPRKQRANRPAVVPRSRATASWHSRYAGFRGSSPRCAHMRHVQWVSDRALPDDARCIRPPVAAFNRRPLGTPPSGRKPGLLARLWTPTS